MPVPQERSGAVFLHHSLPLSLIDVESGELTRVIEHLAQYAPVRAISEPSYAGGFASCLAYARLDALVARIGSVSGVCGPLRAGSYAARTLDHRLAPSQVGGCDEKERDAQPLRTRVAATRGRKTRQEKPNGYHSQRHGRMVVPVKMRIQGACCHLPRPEAGRDSSHASCEQAQAVPSINGAVDA
jgi:hypothetical protein